MLCYALPLLRLFCRSRVESGRTLRSFCRSRVESDKTVLQNTVRPRWSSRAYVL